MQTLGILQVVIKKNIVYICTYSIQKFYQLTNIDF